MLNRVIEYMGGGIIEKQLCASSEIITIILITINYFFLKLYIS